VVGGLAGNTLKPNESDEVANEGEEGTHPNATPSIHALPLSQFPKDPSHSRCSAARRGALDESTSDDLRQRGEQCGMECEHHEDPRTTL
jgi:hypothetical protein